MASTILFPNGGPAVSLDQFSVSNLPIGFQLKTSDGINWQLSVSSATVDHTTVEAVLGNTTLRWLAVAPVGVDPGVRATASADAATLSLAVTGSIDGGYRLDGVWQAGTGGDTDLLLQINGVATGYTTFSTFAVTGDTTFRNFTYTGNFGGGANGTGVAIGRAGGGASHAVLFFSGSITPSSNGSLADVKFEARACDVNGVLFEVFSCRSAVLLAADITQLALVTSGAGNTIKQNSYFRAQKLGLTA